MRPLVSVVDHCPTLVFVFVVLYISVECLGSVCLGKEDLAYVMS